MGTVDLFTFFMNTIKALVAPGDRPGRPELGFLIKPKASEVIKKKSQRVLNTKGLNTPADYLRSPATPCLIQKLFLVLYRRCDMSGLYQPGLYIRVALSRPTLINVFFPRQELSGSTLSTATETPINSKKIIKRHFVINIACI